MREEDLIFEGKLFQPGNRELREKKLHAHKLSQDYNRLYEDETIKRDAILKELLGSIGEETFIQGPITVHYGSHTFIGSNTFINFNFTVQDDGIVRIGDHCSFGPNVTIVTPVHPMLPDERRLMKAADGSAVNVCYAKPVTVENDCWLGANVIVCPGVTIGCGCVIGAGSVVTRSIPEHSFAAGNPCRVIRSLTEADSMSFRQEILGDYSPL